MKSLTDYLVLELKSDTYKSAASKALAMNDPARAKKFMDAYYKAYKKEHPVNSDNDKAIQYYKEDKKAIVKLTGILGDPRYSGFSSSIGKWKKGSDCEFIRVYPILNLGECTGDTNLSHYYMFPRKSRTNIMSAYRFDMNKLDGWKELSEDDPYVIFETDVLKDDDELGFNGVYFIKQNKFAFMEAYLSDKIFRKDFAAHKDEIMERIDKVGLSDKLNKIFKAMNPSFKSLFD